MGTRFKTLRDSSLIYYLGTLMCLAPLPTWAEFEFATNNDGTLTITGYRGLGGDITIPQTIDGLQITAIGEGAFSLLLTITSVTMPDGVTKIGPDAFRDCSGLTNAAWGNTVTNIDQTAFKGCTSLSAVTIGPNVTSIGLEAFSECSSLPAILVSPLNPLYSSADGVLFDKNLSKLIECPSGKTGSYAIPNSVTTIGDSAFTACQSLTNVTIPPSVTSIEADAFEGCFLSTATIPASVVSIGDEAFHYCLNLASIVVDPLNPTYTSADGALLTKDLNTLIQFPAGKSGSYAVPVGVTTIASDAFSWSSNLTAVQIPNTVRDIESYAFSQCTSLTTVTVGTGLTNIGDFAFVGCTSLTGHYCWGDAPTYGRNVFDSDNNTTVYYLPGTIGWGPTFAGRPTAPWFQSSPVILTFGRNFGVLNNSFGFVASWATNGVIAIDASTNLANGSWVPLATNTLANGSFYFSDPAWADNPNRVYRIRSH